MTATSTDFFDITRISVFKDARSTEPATASLRQFLFSKKYTDRIIALRAITDKPERDEIKKTLPAATISGTFTKRASAHITTYNGIVCLDFDAADNPGKTPDEMKATLSEFGEVAYAAVSVGGAGVFALVPTNCTDPTQHAKIVDFLGQLFAHYDLYYDRACKDVSRLRFVSYDPDAYINPAPIRFDAIRIIGLVEQRTNTDLRKPRAIIVRQGETAGGSAPRAAGSGGGASTRERVEACLDAIERTNTDITGNYDDWFRLGMAIGNEFGIDGETYFHRISRFHADYKYTECTKKYQELTRNGRRVRIGTFFTICKKYRIEP